MREGAGWALHRQDFMQAPARKTHELVLQRLHQARYAGFQGAALIAVGIGNAQFAAGETAWLRMEEIHERHLPPADAR